jgi:hypothetical protein
MESVYHIITIHVNETSWAHVWRLRSLYLGMGYDSGFHLRTLSFSRPHGNRGARSHRTRSWMTRKIIFTAPFYCAHGAQLLHLLGCYTVGL